MTMYLRWLLIPVVLLAFIAKVHGAEPRPLVLVVMDPLAAPLSCPCVKGYAQRDYTKLGEFLEEKLGRKVVVKFGESLEKALADVDGGTADLVIGKRSVVAADGERTGKRLAPVADLTGKDGSTLQRGLLVVCADDPAKTVADTKGYRIILGPADCAEKNSALRALFSQQGIELPADCPISASCSDGAAEIVEAGPKKKMATVISSYAQPLLEGCGTIKKGDLRVLAETQPVPFITAFVDTKLDAKLQEAITAALLEVRTQPLLRLAIETKTGFQPIVEPTNDKPTDPKAKAPATKTPAKATSSSDWPAWRGRDRDAVVAKLPAKLPQVAKRVWKKTLLNEGLGGPAVAQGIAVVGDRDSADNFDVFHAVNATTGERLWSLRYPATGRLDYGNSPRATPLIHGEHVYLQGAFGHLHCAQLSDGKIVWKKQLREEFGAREELVWGASSSPLIVDDKLIVNPGGPQASLVALNPLTGEVLWKTPGAPPGFASLIVAPIGQQRQLVGFDKVSCGGWDIGTGKRLWTVLPTTPGDFNVPTPLWTGDKLLLTTENNGTRLIGFGDDATQPREVASYAQCSPDMHTPVLAGERLFAVYKHKVFCFAAADLRLLWTATDRTLQGHVSLIASRDRVLMLTQTGELVLIDALADRLSILSRLPLFDEEVSIYAHPALVGDLLYVRGPGHLFCVNLADV